MSSTENLRNSGAYIEYEGPLGTDGEYEFLEFYTDGDPVVVVTGDWEYAFREGNTFLYRRKRTA